MKWSSIVEKKKNIGPHIGLRSLIDFDRSKTGPHIWRWYPFLATDCSTVVWSAWSQVRSDYNGSGDCKEQSGKRLGQHRDCGRRESWPEQRSSLYNVGEPWHDRTSIFEDHKVTADSTNSIVSVACGSLLAAQCKAATTRKMCMVRVLTWKNGNKLPVVLVTSWVLIAGKRDATIEPVTK